MRPDKKWLHICNTSKTIDEKYGPILIPDTYTDIHLTSIKTTTEHRNNSYPTDTHPTPQR